MTDNKERVADMRREVESVATYSCAYSGAAGEVIAERKGHIAESWISDTKWSDRTHNRNYGDTPDFVRLTTMFERLARHGGFTRAVEIGCGDGKYLAYLRRNTETPIAEWIATDLEGPRLAKAREEVTDIRIEAADILQCAARYGEPGTLFLAANVMGNIAPDDIYAFFGALNKPQLGLVLLAAGLSLESTKPFALRNNGIAFDHNYFDLLRGSTLICREYEVSFDTTVVGYWVAAMTP